MSFPKDFLWGSASSAYQIEGAYNEDGKGLNIWDVYSPGKCKHGDTAKTACDHYHRYKEDVAIMKQMGLKSYRFSVSWARIIPNESGEVNENGMAFYVDLVDELITAGIEPMVTLFHWDLPIWVHKQGGWKNKKIIKHFSDYTKVIVDALSDKVKYWITINEPQYFMGMGYVTGEAAPYCKAYLSISTITKNIMFSHAAAVKAIRRYAKQKAYIGMAPTGQCYTPKDESETEIESAKNQTFGLKRAMFSNAWWADPILLGKSPAYDKKKQRFSLIRFSEKDLREIHQPLDFYGYNVYNSTNYDEYNGTNPAVYPGMPRTAMDWPITPEVLYWSTRFFYERYRLPVLISENGMANSDFVMLDGKIHDPQRIDYIHRHLLQLERAVDEGIPVIGYQYWSIMDNFEWSEGFDKRFGLIHVDYQTQKRTMKDSAYWYAETISSNGTLL